MTSDKRCAGAVRRGWMCAAIMIAAKANPIHLVNTGEEWRAALVSAGLHPRNVVRSQVARTEKLSNASCHARAAWRLSYRASSASWRYRNSLPSGCRFEIAATSAAALPMTAVSFSLETSTGNVSWIFSAECRAGAMTRQLLKSAVSGSGQPQRCTIGRTTQTSRKIGLHRRRGS